MSKKSKDLNVFGEPHLRCPECDSHQVTVTAETSYMVNTGEHYCHSVKTHDSDAKASCTVCSWEGRRHQLEQAR